jgi:predicted nucleic acid-binding protein
MRIVLDTSVLVSASRSRQGASFALMSILPSPRFEFALSVALYTEWQEVLTRPEYYLWRPFLRDPDDDMVLECAVASNSQYLVTHNIQDFQRIVELGVTPITPASFLAFLRSLP